MLCLDLTGKTALVTGGSGQLGRTLCATLAACGANVAVHYHHNGQKAQEIAVSLQRAGVKAAAVQADVADLASVLAMREKVERDLGQVDILINNAVAQYSWTHVLEQDDGDYLSQFQTCVLQAVHMAKAFAPGMVERGYGRIIAINTECAMECFPTQSAYVAGKRGQDGVLRCLAKEIGASGVTVNQVAPGWTISEKDRSAGTEIQPDYSRKVPLGRRGTDQEIANVVAFLASDLASFITGAFIPVCGGAIMPAI